MRALIAIALCLCCIAPAWAQPTVPSNPPPSLPARDPAVGTTPPIAPPAPDASPEEVGHARDTARAAALTPIVPHAHDVTVPAFLLYAEIDLPILTVGLVFVGARLVRTQKAYCAPLCDRAELNALDRRTAGYWSTGWGTASDLAILGLGVGASTFLAVDEGPLAALNDAVVIAESGLSATAAVTIMTLATGRPRPFLYGEKAPLGDRNSTDAGDSFLSSHAAVAFAIATSTYVTARRLHPTSRVSYGVLGAGLAAGSFIAASRVLAGKHFITDALGGALVGSSLGVLISSFHASPVTVVPVVGDSQHGLGVQGAF
ncbi:MAG TPA: phosphatase PAP2 family protein [Kofleriaceae bacterium]|nr:phosphatase PAP2 family protein [Kofleriaceae bacterium]